MTTGTIYVGRAAALIAANVGHLPELAPRHHPAEMQAVVDLWRVSDRNVICCNPCALDALSPNDAYRIKCVASRINPLDGRRDFVMKALIEHPDWGLCVGHYKWGVGEFWASVGEEWVLVASPTTSTSGCQALK